MKVRDELILLSFFFDYFFREKLQYISKISKIWPHVNSIYASTIFEIVQVFWLKFSEKIFFEDRVGKIGI